MATFCVILLPMWILDAVYWWKNVKKPPKYVVFIYLPHFLLLKMKNVPILLFSLLVIPISYILSDFAKKVSKNHKKYIFCCLSDSFLDVAFLLFTSLVVPISYILGYLAPNVRLRCRPIKKVSKKIPENTLFCCCSD